MQKSINFCLEIQLILNFLAIKIKTFIIFIKYYNSNKRKDYLNKSLVG